MLKPDLVKRLEIFLAENEMLGEPATAEQIAEAEKIMNVKFLEDYVDFITRFGGTYAGIDIHAFENHSFIGKESVVELTTSMRESFVCDDDNKEELQQSISQFVVDDVRYSLQRRLLKIRDEKVFKISSYIFDRILTPLGM